MNFDIFNYIFKINISLCAFCQMFLSNEAGTSIMLYEHIEGYLRTVC